MQYLPHDDDEHDRQLRPRLLRETAEIALTELKRFLEPRLCEAFQLRRVSAPLYLPAGSGLNGRIMPRSTEGDNDPQWTRELRPIRFTLPATGQEVEIVTGLDRWLRQQLQRYDIAPGFGVYTVMNALIPDEPVNATHSPHIAAWAWQQAADLENGKASDIFAGAVETLYRIFYDAEQRILGLFPHLKPTLPKELLTLSASRLRTLFPDEGWEWRLFSFMHGNAKQEPHCAVALVSGTPLSPRADIMIWNRLLHRPLRIADIIAVPEAPASIGGNIYRDRLALQLLQQTQILTY